MVRLTKLVIDLTHLEKFKAFPKEEIETSIRLKPGVKTLYAASKKRSFHTFTILEMYTDTAAYKSHLLKAHF